MSITKVNGINIYYELQGSESLPCLILNNGILMNAANSWKSQQDIFSKRYYLLRYDMRGQGASEHPQGTYNMNAHADDLAELMKILNIKKAHIAGLSYGGAITQLFALKYPELCHSLILAGATSEIGAKLKLVVNGWINNAQRGNLEDFLNSTIPWFFTSKSIEENPQIIENARKRYSKLDFESVVELCKSFLSVDFTKHLNNIQIPTCIIVGQEDPLTEFSYIDILKSNICNSELHVIPFASHVVCWEKSEEFNTIVLGFLSKQNV
jgi:3-oxoadipate enol-lactonase